ncbi:MAG: FGGY family carbohydrate kinase, partial [Chloroflexota bacterium]
FVGSRWTGLRQALMALVAGLDFGGGAVKASVADVETGALRALATEATTTMRPAPGRAEFDAEAWWQAGRRAMRAAVARAALPSTEYVAISATSLRQGYVLVEGDAVLGSGVLNSDRRGQPQLSVLREQVGSERLYGLTGHWLAPQLTLPKLLQEQVEDRERWSRSDGVLFVHDWALWRLSGERCSEPSMASAGQLLDIRARAWATQLLDELGLGADRFPALLDAGAEVGLLRDEELGLPLGIRVLAGGGDTQMTAAGAGGLEAGVVSVVAGTTTPLQVSSADVPQDPLRHPWVSAHLRPDRWTAETNAGYAGMNLDWLAGVCGESVEMLANEARSSSPGADGLTAVVASRIWSEQTWSDRSPTALIGFEPRHRRADVARAFIEAHAYAIRANLEDLERALGSAFTEVRLAGGAGRVREFAQLVADVLGRPLQQVRSDYPAAGAFAWLAAGAQVAALPQVSTEQLDPTGGDAYEDGYRRFCEADTSIHREFAGSVA